MTLDARHLDAVVFDYGNTLIEFARPQIEYCDGQLADLLTETFGPFDRARFDALRNADRRAPYRDGFHENDMSAIAINLVRELYGRAPTDGELEAMLQVRYDAFVACIDVEPEVPALLDRLRTRFKLGLLSNYPCGRAIRASISRLGIDQRLDAVVVSADVGHVKPHPRPFEAMLRQLGLAPDRALFVGDNWLGDVQGAKRIGMPVAYTTQYDTPEKFDRQEGDHDPDVTIEHLSELEALLN